MEKPHQPGSLANGANPTQRQAEKNRSKNTTPSIECKLPMVDFGIKDRDHKRLFYIKDPTILYGDILRKYVSGTKGLRL